MKARVPMSNRQKRAARQEVKHILLEEERTINNYLDVSILYAMHELFGFGKDRLKRFYMRFGEIHRAFVDHYLSANRDEAEWVYDKKLKEIGVDVAEWRKELDAIEEAQT